MFSLCSFFIIMYSFGLIPSTDQARNFMFLGNYLGCLVNFTGYNSEM